MGLLRTNRLCQPIVTVCRMSLLNLVILIILSLSSWIQLVDGRKGDRPRYRTAYACEGSQLQISCDEGTLIHLIRANYGRFSISICNEHGNLDWSVDCTSQRSYYVIANSCGMKKSCTLSASISLFDDPCPGTLKYLEAHYQCVPESSSASLSTMKPILLHTLSIPPIKSLPSNLTTPKTPTKLSNESQSSTSESVNKELIPSSSPSPSPKDHQQENTLLIRPPIIVPLTQLHRTTSTTSPDNLIPGEKEKENSVTQSSTVSTPNSTSISSTIAYRKVSPQSSTKTSTTSSTTTSTTISPSFDIRASSPSTTTKSSLSTTTQKSSSIIAEISDNNVVLGNRNVESETMGSIGVIPFDASDSPYCPPVTFRDIRWPPTRTGAVTIESCPPPTHGIKNFVNYFQLK
jgi:latrophilin 1